MPGWYFAHVQADLNLRILRMLEGTFSLDAVQLGSLSGVLNKTTIDKLQTLHHAIDKRPKGKPLITACNHYTCFDDTVLASKFPFYSKFPAEHGV